ncbi:MAG: 4-hydroxythreonine-4-phosphate dehydrogenase PdxA, partial [Candidatus Margulisiibacteriota bacterium]
MPPIVITLGDPAGIGPEVTLKAIEKLNTHPGIILVGHPSCIPQKFPTFTSYTEANKIYIYPISQYEPQSKEDDATNAKIAYQSILSALELSKKIKIKGLVTAPISKTGLKNAKLNLMDHTSILKSFFNCPDAG